MLNNLYRLKLEYFVQFKMTIVYDKFTMRIKIGLICMVNTKISGVAYYHMSKSHSSICNFIIIAIL
jgi:hypothetical protein